MNSINIGPGQALPEGFTWQGSRQPAVGQSGTINGPDGKVFTVKVVSTESVVSGADIQTTLLHRFEQAAGVDHGDGASPRTAVERAAEDKRTADERSRTKAPGGR